MGRRWICTMFGHTGKETESGYHVCGRCGENAFWSSKGVCACYGMDDPGTDYDRNGLLLIPIFWIYNKLKPRIIPGKCPDCGKRFGKHSNCVPF